MSLFRYPLDEGWIDEVLCHALVLTQRHESRALETRLWCLHLCDASHKNLDLLVVVILVGSHGIAMDSGLMFLAVGRLVKISGTISETFLSQCIKGPGRARGSHHRLPDGDRPAVLALLYPKLTNEGLVMGLLVLALGIQIAVLCDRERCSGSCNSVRWRQLGSRADEVFYQFPDMPCMKRVYRDK